MNKKDYAKAKILLAKENGRKSWEARKNKPETKANLIKAGRARQKNRRKKLKKVTNTP